MAAVHDCKDVCRVSLPSTLSLRTAGATSVTMAAACDSSFAMKLDFTRKHARWGCDMCLSIAGRLEGDLGVFLGIHGVHPHLLVPRARDHVVDTFLVCSGEKRGDDRGAEIKSAVQVDRQSQNGRQIVRKNSFVDPYPSLVNLLFCPRACVRVVDHSLDPNPYHPGSTRALISRFPLWPVPLASSHSRTLAVPFESTHNTYRRAMGIRMLPRVWDRRFREKRRFHT